MKKHLTDNKDIRYLTEFINKDGVKYGWEVWATSWEEAQEEADKRGIGEKVIGYQPK